MRTALTAFSPSISSTLETEGTFIYIGLLPNSDQFRSLEITDEEGWIETNENMETNIPGIFAVGDVRKTTYTSSSHSCWGWFCCW